MIPKVVNMRTCDPPWGQPGDVRIDRGSKYGNPFPIGVLTRDECCDMYAERFGEIAWEQGFHISELATAKRLGCWCKPQRCHGDTLVKKIKEYLDLEQQRLL